MHGVRTKVSQQKKTSKPWLGITLALMLLMALSIGGFVISRDNLNLLSELPFGHELQNSTIVYASDTGTTYLGTYKNAVLGVDSGGNTIWSRDTTGSVSSICYDEIGRRVLAGTQGGYIYILSAVDGAEIAAFKSVGRVYAIAVDPASGRLLVSSAINEAKGQLTLYESNGDIALTIAGRVARACAFTKDGAGLISGDARANIFLYDLTGTLIGEYRTDNDVYAMALSDAGDIAVITNAGTLTLLDANLDQVMKAALPGNGRAVGISPDGNTLVAGTREGDVCVYDRAGNRLFATRLTAPISSISIHPERSYIVPLSAQLFSLNLDAITHSAMYTQMLSASRVGMFALPVLVLLSLVMTMGSTRARIFAFARSVYRCRVAYIFLLPTFTLILIFNYFPISQAFYYAFTDWNQAQTSMRDVSFVGFGNFAKMLREGYFLLGVKNMLVMMAFNFVKLLMPLFVAELVFAMSGNKRRYWFRFLFVLPMVVPAVVSALMWKNMYDPRLGLINKLLEVIGRADLARPWLGNEATALGSIIFMGFPWVNSFAFLVFYGGLINIPGDLFEAAKVDGSNPLWNFSRIHIPLISPQIKMIIILTFIGSIQDYGAILLLTNGGPGYATYVPGFEMYLNATLLGQYGYACALGLVLFSAILIGTIANLRINTENALS